LTIHKDLGIYRQTPLLSTGIVEIATSHFAAAIDDFPNLGNHLQRDLTIIIKEFTSRRIFHRCKLQDMGSERPVDEFANQD
jgi:hypothetical protein